MPPSDAAHAAATQRLEPNMTERSSSNVIHHNASSSVIIHHSPSSSIIHHHPSWSIVIHAIPSSSPVIHDHHPRSSVIIHHGPSSPGKSVPMVSFGESPLASLLWRVSFGKSLPSWSCQRRLAKVSLASGDSTVYSSNPSVHSPRHATS